MTTTTLGELRARGLLDFNDGYRTKKDQLATSGFLIIRAGDINNGEVSPTGPDHVADAYVSAIGQKVLHDNDVVLTTKGTIGRTALVKDATGHEIYSPQLCFFRPDSSVLLPKYLYFWLSGPEFTYQSSFMKNSTDMAPYISLSQLSDTRITLPPLPEQQAIAEALGALDDKIAANRKLRATIRDFGRAVTRRAARSAESPTPVDDLATFFNRKRVPLSASQRDDRPGHIPYWGANGRMGWVDEPIFDGQFVLVGEDGSVVTDQGTPVIHNIWGPAWVNNHAHVLQGNTVSTDLLYFLLHDAQIAPRVTGAVQPKLSMGNLKKVELMVPGGSTLQELEATIQPLMAAYRHAAEESRTLAQLRDTLLPALMDGTIRVKDAEKLTEEAI